MRVAELTSTPKGLTLLSLSAAFAATAFTPISYFAARPLHQRGGVGVALAEAAIVLLPVLIFGLISWWAIRRIHRGFLNEIWTREQLTDGYFVLRSQPFMAAFLILAGIFMIYAAAYFMELKPHHLPNLGFAALAIQLPSWVSRAIVQDLKPPVAPTARVDWTSRPRLFSSHWGEPPAQQS